jgi:hypothetical protein
MTKIVNISKEDVDDGRCKGNRKMIVLMRASSQKVNSVLDYIDNNPSRDALLYYCGELNLLGIEYV